MYLRLDKFEKHLLRDHNVFYLKNSVKFVEYNFRKLKLNCFIRIIELKIVVIY